MKIFKKISIGLLSVAMLVSLIPAQFSIAAEKNNYTAEPLEVTRSDIAKHKVMKLNQKYPADKLENAYSYSNGYDVWNETGLSRLLGRVTINGKNIEPKESDASSYDQLNAALNLGSMTSFWYDSGASVIIRRANHTIKGNQIPNSASLFIPTDAGLPEGNPGYENYDEGTHTYTFRYLVTPLRNSL